MDAVFCNILIHWFFYHDARMCVEDMDKKQIPKDNPERKWADRYFTVMLIVGIIMLLIPIFLCYWLAMVYILWRLPLMDGRCLVHEDSLWFHVFDILVYFDRGYRDHIRRMETL